MKQFTKAGLALLAAAAIAAPAAGQNMKKERGNILAVDWNAMQVRLKDPQGRERTWLVARDATVTFTDKREQFPNPRLQDLVAPMYVHFTYNEDTKQITAFDVAEVGFEPSRSGSGSGSSVGSTSQQATVTAVDMNVGHVEVELPGGARKTYEVSPKTQLRTVKAGDRVTLTIGKDGSREVVTAIRRR
jgi:hypothetical protein